MKAEALRSRRRAESGLACVATILAGCSFVLGDLPPTADEKTDGGARGGSGGARGGSGGARGGSGGARGGSDGARGGSGPAGASATGGGASGSSGSGGIPSGCDEDGDRFASVECGGDDCNDTNDDVSPAQTEAFPAPHDERGSFDYNCDGRSEPEGPFVECGLVPTDCPMEGEGFLDANVPCGQTGRWGVCILANMGLSCAEEVRNATRVMACR